MTKQNLSFRVERGRESTMYSVSRLLKGTISSIAVASALTFSGCGGGGGGSSSSTSGTDVTGVDGYIKNATVKDALGQTATYSSSGKYTFSSSPTYPLTLTGGQLEDTNANFDINMTSQSGSSVLSPITTFLGTDSTVLSKFAGLGLNKSLITEFAVDYVNTNDTNLSKLSQLLYAVLRDTNLTNTFKASVSAGSINSLDNLFIQASTDVNNSSLSLQEKLRANTFLKFMKDYNGTAAGVEDDNKTKAFKYNMAHSNDVDKNTSDVLIHNGTSYGTVMSPFTGKIWLDRNLGASEVCSITRGLVAADFNGTTYANETAADGNYTISQTNCFGDYYQWGRNYDGHQESNSTTTATRATNINVTTQQNIVDNNGSFITNTSAPYDWLANNTQDGNNIDDNGSIRSANWSKIDGTSICPVGYRVPTQAELRAETIDLSGADNVQNRADAFNNFLKLPSAGGQSSGSSSLSSQGSYCRLWSSSVAGSDSVRLYFTSGSSGWSLNNRASSFSVRCIKN